MVVNESNSWAIFTSPNMELLRHLKPSKNNHHIISLTTILKASHFGAFNPGAKDMRRGKEGGGGHAHTQWQQRLKASNHIDLLPTWLTPCTVRFSDNAHAHQYTKIYVHALFTHRRRHGNPPFPRHTNSNF